MVGYQLEDEPNHYTKNGWTSPNNQPIEKMVGFRVPGVDFFHPKDHWTLKTGYFEDPNPAIQVQTLPLEGPRSLGFIKN